MLRKEEARNRRSQARTVYKHLKGTHDKGRIAEEPGEGKLCAMSRTERIASRGGRSAEQRTARRPPALAPKGQGAKRMVGKRGTAEAG